MRDITLCVVNYNGADHLRHAFASLDAQYWTFAEILLVDNASTDGSADLACALCAGIRVIRLNRNHGPGAARNAGFAAARSDVILFMDNDVQLEDGTAELLLAELDAHPDTLVVAPRVLYAADTARVQFDSADCHFLGLMATRNADAAVAGLDETACETSSLVTACFLIDRARWTGGDPFDESLGFNLEDHDFGVRARVAGHRLRVQPRARVLHGSGTPGLSYRPGQVPSANRQFYLIRNRWMLVAKCFSARTLLLLAPAFLLFEVAQFAWMVSQRRPQVWWRAAASLWSARHRLSRERHAIQRARREGDAGILRDAPLPLTRHVRGRGLTAHAGAGLDRLLRAYWRGTRQWVT